MAMVSLEHKYSKPFNTKNPKPLKIGISDDILVTDEWDAELLTDTLKKYVRAELYYLSVTNESSRYDLSGDKVSSIAIEDEQHAIDCLRKIIGRFNMPNKYPELVDKEKKITAKPRRPEFYGNQYYHQKRFFELKEVVSECYGRDVKLKQKEAKIINNEQHHTLTTVLKTNTVLFTTEAYGVTRKIANNVLAIKLLVCL